MVVRAGSMKPSSFVDFQEGTDPLLLAWNAYARVVPEIRKAFTIWLVIADPEETLERIYRAELKMCSFM